MAKRKCEPSKGSNLLLRSFNPLKTLSYFSFHKPHRIGKGYDDENAKYNTNKGKHNGKFNNMFSVTTTYENLYNWAIKLEVHIILSKALKRNIQDGPIEASKKMVVCGNIHCPTS